MKRLWYPLAWVVAVVAVAQAKTTRLEDPTPALAVDVSPLTGRLLLNLEDLRAGGDTPWPLSLQRTYQPGWGDPSNHGAAWVSLLDARLVRWKGGFLQLEASGSLRFLRAEGEAWVTSGGNPARLVRTRDGFQLRGGGRSLSFDAVGRLRSVADRGHTLTLSRDASGRVRAVAGPWGRVEVERDGAGVLQALRTEDGRRVRYVRDEAGRLIEVLRPGVRQRFGYDDEGRLDGLSGLVRVAYDAQGRVAKLMVEGLAPTCFAYAGGEGQTLVSTRTQGDRVERCEVEPGLRSVRVERPEGTTVVELDDRGRTIRQLTDGVVTVRSYDARGRLSELRSPGGTYRFTYAGEDVRPRCVAAPHGTFRLTYDHAGRPTCLRSSEATVRWLYDEAGRPVKVATPTATLELTYDAVHRVVASRLTHGRGQVESQIERSAGGARTSTRVSGEGDRQRVVERDPDGGQVLCDRDATGHPLRTVHHDALGRVVARTDSRGVTRRFTYDGLGRWIGLAGPAGERLRASYDLWGRLESLRDANGNTARLSSADGWLTAVEPAWGARSTRRAGTTRTDRAGDVEITATFNERGQLISRTLPEGRERFRYDAEGKLLEAAGPDGGLRYAYDAQGRLTRIGVLGLDAAVDYAYTGAGRLARVRYPWGVVEHRYDGRGRLVALDLGSRGTIELAYDARGRRTRVIYPSGVETHTRYTGERIAEIRTSKDEALLERRAYTYDAAGRVARIDELDGFVTLEHDAQGQLLRATGPGFSRRFAYDAMGNRTEVERDGVTLPLEVGPGNRVLRVGETLLGYGQRGALTQRGEVAYRYDSLNRLVSATLADGSEVRYGYAPGGARLWREDGSGRTWLVPGLAGTAAELGADGELRVGYLHGEGLDEVLGAIHEEAFYAVHSDCVQSVNALTDHEGRVAARYRYTPFGETVAAVGGDWNLLRYTGRPLDPATRLYDVRARAYDPELGRFTSPDPASHRGGANLYAYAANAPVLLRDPLGLWPGGSRASGNAADYIVDRVNDLAGLGGDLVDAGDDAIATVADHLSGVVQRAPAAPDWLDTGPLGITHNPFAFAGLPNPFALEETIAFHASSARAVWSTLTSPITLWGNFFNDPVGTVRTTAELSALLTPSVGVPLLLFGPEEHAGTHLVSSIRRDLATYGDAFRGDPVEFWRRNGELAPTVVGLFLSGGESSVATLLLEINGVLGHAGRFNKLLESAQPAEDEQGRYSAATIPGTRFQSLKQLAIGLVVAEVTQVQVSERNTFSSDLLEEEFDDFHDFVRAALELDEVRAELGGDVDY